MLDAAGVGQLDELITAIRRGSPLVEAARRRLEQSTLTTADHCIDRQADRALVDAWLQLVMDVAVIVADPHRLVSREVGAWLQQRASDLAAVRP